MVPSSAAIPELLAPAGGPQAFRAAVASGADAVYVGVDRLNARRGAENFTLETLGEACRFAHIRGVRVYLTANVLVLPGEMEDALTLVDEAWAAGVDAVIVQDIGLLALLRRTLPHVRIHVSTQVNAHSSATLNALADMGVARVTLARETSLSEIGVLSTAAARAGIEIESFVHGAICVSYSGQCLLSSLIGGRSANRGMCAQPCRLPYELIDGSGAVLETPGAHLLSPKDLAGIGVLPQLLDAGVSSLKIEGRMKSAEYVAVVTGVYRAALDRAAASPDTYEVRDGEMSVLAEAFSRGFSSAYLTDERGNGMMGYSRPNNRGVHVGRLLSVEEGWATVALDTAVSSDDLLEIWTGRGRITQTAGSLLIGDESRSEAPAGARVTFRLDGVAAAGDRVFRVRNAALARAAEHIYKDTEAGPVPVDVAVSVVLGEPVGVRLSDGDGHSGQASGAIVEPARTRPVTAEDVTAHVGRFGGTPFTPATWGVRLSPGAGIGFSELHRVRRAAVDALTAALLEPWADRALLRPRPTRLEPREHAAPVAPRLVAVVARPEAARACLEAGADEVHLDALEPGAREIAEAVRLLPRVCHDPEERSLIASVASEDAVVASTLGCLREAVARGGRVQSHWSLNACNAWTVEEYARMGVSLVWLSPELSGRQIADVASRVGVPVGVAVAGRQEVMVTEHCVLMAEGECDRRCGVCTRRQSIRTLRDRKGYEFPVRTDRLGRTHLFNSVPLDLTHALGEVLATGVAAVRVDLETESDKAAVAEVRRVRLALDHALSGSGRMPPKVTGATSGHFFRGVT